MLWSIKRSATQSLRITISSSCGENKALATRYRKRREKVTYLQTANACDDIRGSRESQLETIDLFILNSFGIGEDITRPR